LAEKKVTDKEKETLVKTFLVAKGHKADVVQAAKGDTKDDLFKLICAEVKADHDYLKKVIGGIK
jgi:hypothetical protein